MRPSLRHLGFWLLAAPLLGLVACGDTKLPEAPSTAAFENASVAVHQAGNAPVTVNTSTVSFALDDARTLHGSLSVTSHATATVTIIVRVSLYNSAGGIVGDATGGQVAVAPGASATIPLTGPAPIGTIASVTVEVSIPPPPTPVPEGSPTPVSQLPIPTAPS